MYLMYFFSILQFKDLPQNLGSQLPICICSRLLLPEHFFPPFFDGGGLLHNRFLIFLQPALHFPNGPQSPQFPFTIFKIHSIILLKVIFSRYYLKDRNIKIALICYLHKD